jgi:hypothetical protein
LKDIEDIKKWGIEVENKTQLLENYIDFGNYPIIIKHYMALKKGIGYQGLIYREAVGNLNYFSKSITNKKYLLRVQFKCFRRKIIQHLIAADQAKYTGIPTKPF